MSQLFTSGGQSIGVSASASVLPVNIALLTCSQVPSRRAFSRHLPGTVRTNTGAGFYIVRLRLAVSPSVNLRKLKSLSHIIEIITGIFSGYNTMRLDINYRGKKAVKNTNTWRLNNTFLNNEKVTEEIQREIKKFLETNDNGNMTAANLWAAADSRWPPPD